MTRTGGIVTAAGAALAGAAVGYIAGVLSAPASGRDTRARLEHKVDDLVRQTKTSLKETQDRISAAVHS